MKNPTVFITCYHGLISRNILNSSVLKILKDRDVKVVVFAPPDKKSFLEENYGDPNIIIEGVDLEAIVRSRRNKFWYRLAFLLQNSYYVIDQRKERLFNNRNVLGYLNYLLVNTVAFVLSNFRIFHFVYRYFDYQFSPKNIFNEYIRKYNPELIFATDIFSEYDPLFLREAKARGIKTIGMVRSWDNTTTKGILRIIPDEVLVNSPTGKRELIKMHDLKEKHVKVVGLPQFDDWLFGPTMSREEFFKKIGADYRKRLILFSPAGNILSDTDWQICQILKDAISAGELSDDIQFLIRNHPSHPADLSKFEKNDHFIYEMPGTRFGSGYRNAELSPDENSHLCNSVYYSDVVIYIATSLGLDAAVFDKPQIIVSFDGWETKPYLKSVKRYHNEDNLRNLIVLGGTKVVESRQDLITWINKYLENPEIDCEGRKKIVTEHLYKIDGKSGERIATIVLGHLSDS